MESVCGIEVHICLYIYILCVRFQTTEGVKETSIIWTFALGVGRKLGSTTLRVILLLHE